MSLRGRVLRFERSSNKDGFGLRTVVFLKGCPLKCEWCSTPESQNSLYEVGFLRSKCTECHRRECEAVCTVRAISLDGEPKPAVDGAVCTGCGNCAKACSHNAAILYGMDMTSDEVVDEAGKDSVFYHHGGGITLSGGEVLAQPDFALEITKKALARGIDVTIETSCYASWGKIEPLLPYLKSMFIDIKLMEPSLHKKYTSVDNGLILDNIRRIDKVRRTKIIIRVPFIPTVNDNTDNFELLAEFCKTLENLAAVEILPYHRLGIETYKKLGRLVPFPGMMTPTRSMIETITEPLQNALGNIVRII